jgi:hypothetical protein
LDEELRNFLREDPEDAIIREQMRRIQEGRRRNGQQRQQAAAKGGADAILARAANIEASETGAGEVVGIQSQAKENAAIDNYSLSSTTGPSVGTIAGTEKVAVTETEVSFEWQQR